MAEINPYKKQGDLAKERDRADKYLKENSRDAQYGVSGQDNGVYFNQQAMGQTGVQTWAEEKARINRDIKRTGASTPTYDLETLRKRQQLQNAAKKR